MLLPGPSTNPLGESPPHWRRRRRASRQSCPSQERDNSRRVTLIDATMGKTDPMAFGQQSGPPASAAQLRDLLALLKDAGHVDFRDARGPMGFTQRQAGGKFSRDEAEAFITQLEDAASTGATGDESPTWRLSAQEQTVRALPTAVLAEELRRRGWIAVEVPDPAQEFPAP